MKIIHSERWYLLITPRKKLICILIWRNVCVWRLNHVMLLIIARGPVRFTCAAVTVTGFARPGYTNTAPGRVTLQAGSPNTAPGTWVDYTVWRLIQVDYTVSRWSKVCSRCSTRAKLKYNSYRIRKDRKSWKNCSIICLCSKHRHAAAHCHLLCTRKRTGHRNLSNIFKAFFAKLLSFHVWNILLIRIPLNSKQNLADEWLRINLNLNLDSPNIWSHLKLWLNLL